MAVRLKRSEKPAELAVDIYAEYREPGVAGEGLEGSWRAVLLTGNIVHKGWDVGRRRQPITPTLLRPTDDAKTRSPSFAGAVSKSGDIEISFTCCREVHWAKRLSQLYSQGPTASRLSVVLGFCGLNQTQPSA